MKKLKRLENWQIACLILAIVMLILGISMLATALHMAIGLFIQYPIETFVIVVFATYIWQQAKQN